MDPLKPKFFPTIKLNSQDEIEISKEFKSFFKSLQFGYHYCVVTFVANATDWAWQDLVAKFLGHLLKTGRLIGVVNKKHLKTLSDLHVFSDIRLNPVQMLANIFEMPSGLRVVVLVAASDIWQLGALELQEGATESKPDVQLHPEVNLELPEVTSELPEVSTSSPEAVNSKVSLKSRSLRFQQLCLINSLLHSISSVLVLEVPTCVYAENEFDSWYDRSVVKVSDRIYSALFRDLFSFVEGWEREPRPFIVFDTKLECWLKDSDTKRSKEVDEELSIPKVEARKQPQRTNSMSEWSELSWDASNSFCQETDCTSDSDWTVVNEDFSESQKPPICIKETNTQIVKTDQFNIESCQRFKLNEETSDKELTDWFEAILLEAKRNSCFPNNIRDRLEEAEKVIAKFNERKIESSKESPKNLTRRSGFPFKKTKPKPKKGVNCNKRRNLSESEEVME